MNGFGIKDEFDDAYQMMCEDVELGLGDAIYNDIEDEPTEPVVDGPLYDEDTATMQVLIDELEYNPSDASGTQRSNTKATYGAAVKEFVSRGILSGESKVLDYSAGLGVGAGLMRELGLKSVDTYEPYPPNGFNPDYSSEDASDVPNDSYDLVIVNYVVNVVPIDIRTSIIERAFSKVKPGGHLFVTSMTPADISQTIKKGAFRHRVSTTEVITSRGSYQKAYTQSALNNFVQSVTGASEVTPRPKAGKAKILVQK